MAKAKPQKKPTGRPSTYTDTIGKELCERLIAGESVRQITVDEGFPEERTIYRWLAANDSFRQQYAIAREHQMERMAAEILEISDDGQGDSWVDEEGVEHVNNEVLQRSRLRVDTRKWLMSKLAPKKYGERIHNEHSGTIDIGLAERIEAARKRKGG